jgi:hypothetical protein
LSEDVEPLSAGTWKAKLATFAGPGGGVSPLVSRLPTVELRTSLLFSGALDAHRFGLVGEGGRPRWTTPAPPEAAVAGATAAAPAVLGLAAPAVDGRCRRAGSIALKRHHPKRLPQERDSKLTDASDIKFWDGLMAETASRCAR